MADEALPIEHHEVHRPEVRGIRIELVDDVEDELLAGMRDVHRGETLALRFGEETAHVCRGPSELDEIEDAVLVVETERGRLSLVHGRGEGCRDALADETDEVPIAMRSHG